MGYSPSTGQIMSSLNKRLNQIDRTLEFENEKREALLSTALAGIAALEEYAITKKKTKKVKRIAKNYNFTYDKSTKSFYKLSEKKGEEGIPLEIDFDTMSQNIITAETANKGLDQILYGSDLEGNINYSKEKQHYMSFDKQKKLLKAYRKGDRHNIVDWGAYERSANVLNTLGWETKQSDFLDQVNLDTPDALKKLNEHFKSKDPDHVDYSTVQDYFVDMNAREKEGILDIKDIRKFGQYGDTHLAIINNELAHVNPEEAEMIALDPRYAQHIYDIETSYGQKEPKKNPVTGLYQYGLLGTLGGIAVGAAGVFAGAAAAPWLLAAGGVAMVADMFIGGSKKAAAAERKKSQIEKTQATLGAQQRQLGTDKTEQMEDLYATQTRAIDDLQTQSANTMETLNMDLAKVTKSGKGLNLGQVENIREQTTDDILTGARRQEEETLLTTERQATEMANTFDTQISDIAMNIDDLAFQYDELEKQDTMWENLF